MPEAVLRGDRGGFVDVDLALVVPDVLSPDGIERGLFLFAALLFAELERGEGLLRGRLFIQALFAGFEELLLLHLRRQLAETGDRITPDVPELFSGTSRRFTLRQENSFNRPHWITR